jgi:hypothetical protein
LQSDAISIENFLSFQIASACGCDKYLIFFLLVEKPPKEAKASTATVGCFARKTSLIEKSFRLAEMQKVIFTKDNYSKFF